MKRQILMFLKMFSHQQADGGAAQAAPKRMAADAQETLNLAWLIRTRRRGPDQQKSKMRDDMQAAKAAGCHQGKEQEMM